ncbi:T9SS type A sorting domain-containing protein [Chryseobacterium sp. SNU WT5]|uniref:T9SS type A sorting domain-containing protein n=1 Tax=Chryseobacterium sp. SNU WT5 TaxID=2594269 RepID=UPI00117E3BEB|nr:T9SS type A sorting domain-containing protein [Chryseobacterium sp. SNU WT5]QDP84629.1 T9SS type A sorting domain-containing protein [Chryseobacterium sp. SNU WT5]
MNKIYYLILSLLPTLLFSQFDPAAGQPGSKAIHKDDLKFVNWATGITVDRGPQDISASTPILTTAGTPSNATGKATGSSIVSLGDGGSAILTFAKPITNGEGVDFAVFENSFSDTFLELAFVEASSDGIHFFRFPAISNTSTANPVGSFGNIDPTQINNLAGKYKATYGTPFDISELPNDASLNKLAITHIKIIDVIGTINPSFATYDSIGNIINDPYPTNFNSGGFDLDAVGVINEWSGSLSTNQVSKSEFEIYPNPATDFITIKTKEAINNLTIYSMNGQRIVMPAKAKIDVRTLAPGQYLLEIITDKDKQTRKFIKK